MWKCANEKHMLTIGDSKRPQRRTGQTTKSTAINLPAGLSAVLMLGSLNGGLSRTSSSGSESVPKPGVNGA